MKIGLVRRGFSRSGGAEAYLRRFADAAVAAGHECLLFASEEWPRDQWPWELCRVEGRTPRRFADALEALRPRERCDFVFSLERVWSCDAYRAGDGVHAAWLRRRAEFEPRWAGWVRSFRRKHREILALERRLFAEGGARAVIANSRMVREEIVQHFGYDAAKIHVVYNGVPAAPAPPGARAEVRRELGLSETDYVALFAGSGWERKGLRYAIAAVERTAAPQPVLLIAGRGRRRGLPASERARFLGPVADLPRWFAAADVFLLPTLYEPFSNACLEAAAAGLPVITTRGNGFAEIVENGVESEAVADPRDAAALAAALEAWRPPERRAAIRPRLQELGRSFSIQRNAEETLRVIEAVNSPGFP